jgi:DNA invertase Pin-like site-specific DNA recombinase
MPTCYGYGRASTDKQELTEEVQLKSVKRQYDTLLKPKGVQWGGFFYDAAVSGGKPFTERPEGLKMWMHLMPGDYVVTHHSDRAFRDTADGLRTAAMFRARGVTLVMPDIPHDLETADGEMMATIQFALNLRERRKVGERTSAAMRVLAERGERFGGSSQGCPIGWMWGGTGLAPDQDERDKVEQMAKWHAEGLSHERISMRVTSRPYQWRRRNRVPKFGNWSRRYVALALEARRLGYPKVYLNSPRRKSAAGRTHRAAST